MTDVKSESTIGRNEPCPCGSKKKYKRCCGVSAAPKLNTPAQMQAPAAGGPAGGFDPSQMDPVMMGQLSQALQKLPRGQMQRLQSLMQKAMAGKDVSREAAEFEKTLPPDFQNLMSSFGQSAFGAQPSGADSSTESNEAMSEDQARKIVEAAAASGKISAKQAEALLQSQGSASESKPSTESKFSKLWKSFGKKS